jgi:putative ABC transport system permease protein
MGASSRTIFSLLLKSHLKLVVIANVISWPLAYYIMKMFLQIFAYRINISIFVFVATGLITFLIMFLTVGYHILKASRTNPIKELRYE